MSRNILHSSATNEHYTPRLIAQKSKAVMGGIELDPASNELANSIIQAERYYSIEQNGLKRPWRCKSMLLNPPGGQEREAKALIERYGTNSRIGLWFNVLRDRWQSGEVEQAVFVGFQLSVLRVGKGILEMPFCIPASRLHFWVTPEALRMAEAGKKKPNLSLTEKWIQDCFDSGEFVESKAGILLPSRSPSHDNVIVFLPPLTNTQQAISRFAAEFGEIGELANCSLLPPSTPKSA